VEPNLNKARVLIVVKTYPLPSRTYDELVCTAGLLNGKEWVRIYPVPFRGMAYEQRFKKWEWIELDLEKPPPGRDQRPESYRPRRGIDEPITVLGPLEPMGKSEWAAKRSVLLPHSQDSFEALLDQKNRRGTSLGVIKPRTVFGVSVTKEPERWTEAQQQQFFEFVPPSERRDTVKPAKPVPYRFHFAFDTSDGVRHNLAIEDWEIGILYWHSLDSVDGDERAACELVKTKLNWMVAERDLYLIVGTTWRNHHRAENPFTITGLFYPPQLDPPGQLGLFS
jgi:hypothetical protein